MDYQAFIEENIVKYKELSKLIENDEVTPSEINRCLAEYSNVNLALISSYQLALDTYSKLELNYSVWWDEKFTEVRRMNNDVDKPASKWLSKAELESETRYLNKDEYLEFKKELQFQESKLSFHKQLLDNWKKFDGILIALSNNMRQEMRALSLESRINYDNNKVRVRKAKSN